MRYPRLSSSLVSWVLALTPTLFISSSSSLAEKGSENESYPGRDWPQFRGPNRDGISAETGWTKDWPKEGLERLWKAKVGTGYSGIVVAGDRAYTMGRKRNKDAVYCLSTETGKVLWDYVYKAEMFDTNHDGGPASTPTVDGERVYTLSREGQLHCFNAVDGELIWEIEAAELLSLKSHVFGFVTSPLIDGDQLILDLGIVLSLSKETTEAIWNSEPYPPSYGSPVPFELDGQPLLISFNEYGPVVLNRNTGAEIQKTRWETWSGVNAVTPVLSGNRFFISSGYGTGGAVFEVQPPSVAEVPSATQQSTNELKLVWRNKNMSNHFSTSVLWEGYLYGFDEATFKCLDFDTGEEQWLMEGFGKGSVSLADGHLLLLSERGELILARPTPEGFDGLALDHVLGGQSWTPPILSHGRIYCRNSKGDIVCLDVRPNPDS